jgi:hypothetical protein
MNATVEVNRLALMKLIYRYKGLLEWELDYLRQLGGDVVPITLPTLPVMPPDPPPPPPPETGSVGPGAPLYRLRGSGPGNLENSCVAGIESIDSYEELVDAATPYVRALAEK